MPDVFAALSQYISFFPPAAFFCLLLAGFNIPISEDLIIITGALLCHEEPSLRVPALAAIYSGVIVSDCIAFWLGIQLRKGAVKTRLLTRLLSPVNLEKMHVYLNKYGIFAFIIGRFIPFGVRNTLFMSSGFFGLRLRTFALYDIIAAGISVTTLFCLIYNFGEDLKTPVKFAGILLFVILVSGVLILLFRGIRRWRDRKRGEV